MYNVLLKVKTQLVYILSGVITPCVRDFNTILRSCNTSTTMFNQHVCAYNMKKTPKETRKTFLECSEIWMIYDMPMYNRWMQKVKYDSVRIINTFPYILVDKNKYHWLIICKIWYRFLSKKNSSKPLLWISSCWPQLGRVLLVERELGSTAADFGNSSCPLPVGIYAQIVHILWAFPVNKLQVHLLQI